MECVPNDQKKLKDNPNNRIEYKGALKCFTDKYGQEIYEPINKNHGFYITLPECFQFEKFVSISLTGQFTRVCNDKSTYFTIDAITEKDISYYKDYFENKKTKTESNIQILRDYVMEIRAVGLVETQKSVHSSIKTNKGKEMLLGTVVGKINTYGYNLSYQYGVISVGKTYYVLQAISEVDNFKYLREDILQIFKSFRAR